MSAIVSRFRETASRFPDRPALIGPDQTISYRELESRVAAAAAAIRQHATADTVALLCPNTTAFPVLLLAAMWAGKTIAILPTLAPAPLLKMMAAEVGAELVITTEEFVPRLVELQVACWIGEANGFDHRDVMLAILPLFHAYGLTVTIVLPLTEGAAIVIPDRFIPRAILQTIEQHKVTAFVAVPGQY